MTALPNGITTGPDGNLWFTEYGSGKIGRITPGGVINEFLLPNPNSGPFSITSGPDGNLWFTEYMAGKIGSITASGVIREFLGLTGRSQPFAITSGPDGNLWFTEYNAGRIGRVDTNGFISEFSIPNGSGGVGITTGPDGNLWITEQNAIARMSPSGAYTEFPIPTGGANAYAITRGPDGNLWFTESAGDNIGRITTTGFITEFYINTPHPWLTGITAGPDGKLWFTEWSQGRIGSITTNGAITETQLASTSSGPLLIVAGPDNNLWFTQNYGGGGGGSIGQANIGCPQVSPPVAITTTALPQGNLGTAYLATLSATGGSGVYQWSATGLPVNFFINSATGVITGLPAAAGNATVSVTVTDASNPKQTATANLTLTITSAASLVINTTSLPGGSLGAPYSAAVTASGGTGQLTWSATGLPAGLSIDPIAGVISGTPSATGTATAMITVKDSGSPQVAATKGLTIAITGGGVLTITTTTLPNGEIGQPYLATLSATGGTAPLTWRLAGGRLPGGLSLDAAAGQISGTPTVVTGTILTLTVSDSGSTPQSASATLLLTIDSNILTVTTTYLPSGQVGVPYSAQLAATGGTKPYSWFLLDGYLPPGLSLNAGTGQISGTPTYPVANLRLVFHVTDSGVPQQEATQSLPMTMAAGPLAITTTSLPASTAGSPYSSTVTAVSGSGAYTWSASGLPAGLSMNAASGTISGTPAAAGTSAVMVIVKDSGTPQQSASANFSLSVMPATLTITTTSLPTGTPGSSYTAGLSAAGGTPPLNWSASGLPANLSINGTTGLISGTPATAGTSMVNVTAKDSGSPPQSVTATLSLSIAGATPVILTTSLPDGEVGLPYSITLNATGGAGALTWSITSGRLPGGLVLNAMTGQISGTPLSATGSWLTFRVTDSGSPAQSATASFLLTIDSSVLTVTTTSLPAGTVGVPYSATLTATGGIRPYRWFLLDGALPPGLALDAGSGVISGTPTYPVANLRLVFHVADSGNPPQEATQSLPMTMASGQ
jgi:streptogramin lyase